MRIIVLFAVLICFVCSMTISANCLAAQVIIHNSTNKEIGMASFKPKVDQFVQGVKGSATPAGETTQVSVPDGAYVYVSDGSRWFSTNKQVYGLEKLDFGKGKGWFYCDENFQRSRKRW